MDTRLNALLVAALCATSMSAATLATDPTPRDQPPDDRLELVGAGWSYGFCAGFCRADLQIEGDRLVVEGRVTLFSEPMWTNTGRLTEAGHDELERSLDGVEQASLEAMYGCPDCAAGGAAHVQLRQGAPPPATRCPWRTRHRSWPRPMP